MTLFLSYQDDVYEIHLRGNIIIRIVRYAQGSELRKELEWEDMSQHLQKKVLGKITESRQKDDEN